MLCKQGGETHLQVDGEDFEADVVVVQLVVGHGNVHIQGYIVSVLQQQALVNVCGFLKVALNESTTELCV